MENSSFMFTVELFGTFEAAPGCSRTVQPTRCRPFPCGPSSGSSGTRGKLITSLNWTMGSKAFRLRFSGEEGSDEGRAALFSVLFGWGWAGLSRVLPWEAPPERRRACFLSVQCRGEGKASTTVCISHHKLGNLGTFCFISNCCEQ